MIIFPSEPKVKLDNYLDLLLDEEIDNITKCPVCISNISEVLNKIYLDLKKSIEEGKFQKFMRKRALLGILDWKNNTWPIPIFKLKEILLLWKEVCNKSWKEHNDLYEEVYQKTEYFKARCSPVHINIVKSIDSELAYLLGVIYADGSLRNIYLTQTKEKRFRYEITITDVSKENLEFITKILERVFGIKTKVKTLYNGRWYRILFYSMILHRILNKVFEMPMGYKKGKLRIPKIIEKAPLEIRKYFLIGFFDGDGWCNNKINKKFTPIISVSQADKKILYDLKLILEEFGFNFRLRTHKRGKFVWYELNTKSKIQIKKFYDKIGFLHPDKSKRLKNLIEHISI